MQQGRILRLMALSLLAGAFPLLSVAQQSGGNATASTQPATGGGICVEPSAVTAVSECPANAPTGARTPRTGASAPRSNLRTSKRNTTEKKQGPQGPGIDLDAATRQGREATQARADSLLAQEIQRLDQIIQRMRPDNTRRPEYLLRRAETQFEMQQSANTRMRGLDEPIFQAKQANNARRVRELEQQQQQAEQAQTQARERAITDYATLVRDHPNFPQMDQVLFSLGFALEEMHQFDRAREVYRRLIKGFPQSRFIPHAYLSFAEYYFGEAADMRAALQFYEKVAQIPPDRNPVYGYALYKQAWAYYNLQDFRGSLQKFVEVIQFASQNPEARDAANLARQARRELVLPYSQVGNPSVALDAFRRLATTPDQAYEMLESLGELYFDTGQWPNTIAVYHKLMAEQPSSAKLCKWQGRVTNAIISSRPKAEQTREVERLIDVWEQYQGGSQSAEAKAECKESTASILIELATAWHREAIGTDTQPGTNDRGTMNQAVSLYKLLIEKFPDMEQMRFPDINEADWPTQYKVAYYYAELLWKMENWAECGPAFDKVVEINPTGEYTADAAYAAVLCYNNVYQQEYARREREVRQEPRQGEGGGRRRGRRGQQQEAPTPAEERARELARYASREYTPVERGMLNAFQRYICFVPDSDELPNIKYRRARIFYESNHYEEASVIFKDIAMNHRTSELGVYAANLYLDSLNNLYEYRDPQRGACLTSMQESIEPLSGIYCATAELKESNAELCNVIADLRCGLKRKQIENMATNRQWSEAARASVDLFRNNQECGRMDEVLWNAAIYYEAGRLVGRAIRVRNVLIQRFPESEFSKKALYLLGANYHALAIYGQAAEYYEQFARKYPGEDGQGSRCTDAERTAGTCPNAPEALQNAVFFRLGLGEEEKAVEDARLFETNYRRTRPREASQVVFSLGSIYKRQANWPRVIAHYQQYLRDYARQALPNEVIRANVEIANAYWQQNDKTRAEPFYRAAVQAWERGDGGAAAAIARLPDSTPEELAKYLKAAKEAAAEAYFYTAEYLFAAYQRLPFPAYRGGRDAAAVTRWAQNEFAQWLQRKVAALQLAEAAYLKVRQSFCPPAPTDGSAAAPCFEVPQWQIAAAARTGEMYRVFVDAFDDAPIPTEVENDPELYEIYVGELNRQRQIFFSQAIPKFEFCLLTATTVRWFNEFSRQCEVELNRLEPQRYPLAAEVQGNAIYIQQQRAVPGPVELSTTAEEEEVGGGADSSAPPAAGGN